MLLLRYQRQRQQEHEGHSGGAHHHVDLDVSRRKLNDRDLKGESHRAATRGTLICIFVCGFLLLGLGLTLLFVGLLVPGPRSRPTPWLVTGPTCIVLGILVLLLSVEIILKLRKISASTSSSVESSDTGPVVKKQKGWGGNADEEEEGTLDIPVPVVIQPPTPSVQRLDPNALVDMIQHR